MLPIKVTPPEEIVIKEYELELLVNSEQDLTVPCGAEIFSVVATKDCLLVFAKVDKDLLEGEWKDTYKVVMLETGAPYKPPKEGDLAFLDTVWCKPDNRDYRWYYHVFYYRLK